MHMMIRRVFISLSVCVSMCLCVDNVSLCFYEWEPGSFIWDNLSLSCCTLTFLVLQFYDDCF